MKKIHLLLLIISFAPAYSWSQSLSDTTWQKAFLFEQFIDGTVLLKSGGKEQAPLNYNTDNQQIYFIQNGQFMVLTGLEGIDTIYIQGRKFVPVENKVYEVPGNRGKIELYITYTNKMHPYTATADYNGTSRKDNNKVSNTVSNVYVMRPYKGQYMTEIITHYWLRRGHSFYKANNEKQLVNVFPFKDSDAIKNYIKENNIDFSKQADVVKLVTFCNAQMK